MRIAFLTNEYPPNVYGGAGVHVEFLTRELASLGGGAHEVRVLCFGEQQEQSPHLAVQGIHPTASLPYQDPRHEKFFSTLLQGLAMSGTLAGVEMGLGLASVPSSAGGVAAAMQYLAGGKK